MSSLLIDLNRRFSERDNWCPADFGALDFDNDFIEKVKEFQTSYGIKSTGLVGLPTFRRLTTEKEAKNLETQKHIICNGKSIPIKWDKVITFQDKNGFVAPEGSYKKANRTNIKMMVTHFDVCLSSKSCFEVLKQRNLSVVFLIDNDGTIFQTVDTQHVAWHARGVNESSVGVEISNAFYSKFQPTYEKLGFGPRPIISGSVIHGQKLEPHLGFYPVQIEALKALYKALHDGLGIELITPNSHTTVPEVVNNSYRGIIHHYHVTKEKIDSAGLDLVKLVEDIKNG